tara:strand:+ start:578 stop:1441 length:864 start_codon:yes stop_codon:yes gene_type:complete
MGKSHNKKRNVGIIYELLLRNISSSLIKNDKKSAQKALDIIEKRFAKSTELYKEFRLFNALAKSTVSDTSVASAILIEAKNAARRCNFESLNKEKSLLIRDINYNLNDKKFYHRRVPEYKTYATIQTLLNEWRLQDSSDLTKTIQFESKVAEWLIDKSKEDMNEGLENSQNPTVDSLVVKIMSEKINEKYGGKLGDLQRRVLQEYIFSLSENKDDKIRSLLSEIKNNTVDDLENLKNSTKNNVILEKIEDVKSKILAEDVEKINDESISRFLVLINLRKEISEAIDE